MKNRFARKISFLVAVAVFFNAVMAFDVRDAQANLPENLQSIFGEQIEICSADGSHFVSADEFAVLLDEIEDEFFDKNLTPKFADSLVLPKEYFTEISNLESREITNFSSVRISTEDNFYLANTSLDPPHSLRFI